MLKLSHKPSASQGVCTTPRTKHRQPRAYDTFLQSVSKSLIKTHSVLGVGDTAMRKSLELLSLRRPESKRHAADSQEPMEDNTAQNDLEPRADAQNSGRPVESRHSKNTCFKNEKEGSRRERREGKEGQRKKGRKGGRRWHLWAVEVGLEMVLWTEIQGRLLGESRICPGFLSDSLEGLGCALLMSSEPQWLNITSAYFWFLLCVHRGSTEALPLHLHSGIQDNRAPITGACGKTNGNTVNRVLSCKGLT